MTASAAPNHAAFSFGRIFAIANNTLLELVRLKVFYFLLIFALIIIGSSAFMYQFSFQEQFQVLKDVSLGAMSIFSWLLAVLATAMLLPNDIEDRTLYTILAKPVPRLEYLIGKIVGVCVLLLVLILIMTGLFLVVLYFRQQSAIAIEVSRAGGSINSPGVQSAIAEIHSRTFTANLVPGIAIIFLKAALFATLTLFISTFATSSIFTIMVSVAVYLIGNIQGIAREYWLNSGAASPISKVFLGVVVVLFPDMQLFDLVDDIVVGNAIRLSMFLQTCGLGLTYIAVYFFLAYLIFANKEL